MISVKSLDEVGRIFRSHLETYAHSSMQTPTEALQFDSHSPSGMAISCSANANRRSLKGVNSRVVGLEIIQCKWVSSTWV